MPNVDGRVAGLNTDVFNTLQTIKGRNKGALTEADAQQLHAAINKDGKVDGAENDLLSELTQDKVRTINISSAANPTNVLTFGTSTGKVQASLLETQTPTSYLNELTNKGAEGFKELTAIYQRSPADANRVVNVLSNKASQAWEKSAISNAYSPLRTMIADAYAGVNQLQGKDNDAGRWMLHRAIEKTDRNADGSNGAVPDFLYNWIRPGGVI